ncbi:MAG: heme o synthase [Infirmifilum sp.]
MNLTFKELLFDFFKLKQSLLLIWTGFFAFLAASNVKPNPSHLVLTLLSMFFTMSGTVGLNMVLDADIDSLMFRTHRRPIPSGRLSKQEGALLSLLAVAIGLVLGVMVNFWVFLAGLLGFTIDIILYTYLLKRRSPWSTVFGGFAGGMPALGGWVGATGSLDMHGVLLMLLVAVWSNLHIWTLATYYVEDYRRASVPMLPVVMGERAGVLGSITSAIIIGLIVYSLYTLGVLTTYGFLLSIVPLVIVLFYLTRGLMTKEYKTWSYKAFKIANMFMAIVFLALILR